MFLDVYVHLSNLSNVGAQLLQQKQHHQQLIVRCRHILDIFELEYDTVMMMTTSANESILANDSNNTSADLLLCSSASIANNDEPYLNMSATGNKCTLYNLLYTFPKPVLIFFSFL